MEKQHPVFNDNECISCGICAQTCPVSAINMSHARKQGKYKKPCPTLLAAACLGCGLCAQSCPMGAVTMESIKNEG